MSDTTANSDFKINTKEDKQQIKKEDKEDKITNYVFSLLILITVGGTGLMANCLNDFRQVLIDLNPNYNFPQYSDLSLSLISMIVLIIGKIVIEKLTLPISESIISRKYQDPSDEANYQMGRIYVKKLSTNIFKLCFYTFMTIFGYFLLYQLDYFPTTLLGRGNMMNMFEPGYPDMYFHWKPNYFNIYYLTGLGFCLTDLIWLIFVYELQSDFVMMLLHHLCTISLIMFSFLTNYTNIGCIVLFLHDFGDIFVYITRLVINTDAQSYLKISSAVILVVVFIYTRLFVFGNLLYSIWSGISWGFKWPDTSLFLFLCFLYIMHVNWVYLILKKIVKGLTSDKIEDTASVKKCSKIN